MLKNYLISGFVLFSVVLSAYCGDVFNEPSTNDYLIKKINEINNDLSCQSEYHWNTTYWKVLKVEWYWNLISILQTNPVSIHNTIDNVFKNYFTIFNQTKYDLNQKTQNLIDQIKSKYPSNRKDSCEVIKREDLEEYIKEYEKIYKTTTENLLQSLMMEMSQDKFFHMYPEIKSNTIKYIYAVKKMYDAVYLEMNPLRMRNRKEFNQAIDVFTGEKTSQDETVNKIVEKIRNFENEYNNKYFYQLFEKDAKDLEAQILQALSNKRIAEVFGVSESKLL